ncbi:type II toxin-antitoxin system death-on-curing family toxin [Caballeronia sp. GAWG2-1]|uniref:type II toxin-antitoxin system death-on-curing family toxin n=1 Tax=Caballeronia sp. GAWG2-1 TaxID=2921744 RepID=UPI0032F036A1
MVAHVDILAWEGGLPGFAQAGPGGVDAVLARVESRPLRRADDIFGIAAMYAVAIARGHVFNDGNKRTALVCALAYLGEQGYDLSATPDIEEDLVETMVDVAEGNISREELADYLGVICAIR